MVRFKNRYFLVELRFENDDDKRRILSSLTARGLVQELRKAVKLLFGDYGLASVQCSLSIKYINVMTQTVIVRCCRAHHRMVWSVLTMTGLLGGAACCIDVLHLAGTIRSCQKFLIKHNKKVLESLIRDARTPVERKKLQELVEKATRDGPPSLR